MWGVLDRINHRYLDLMAYLHSDYGELIVLCILHDYNTATYIGQSQTFTSSTCSNAFYAGIQGGNIAGITAVPFQYF